MSMDALTDYLRQLEARLAFVEGAVGGAAPVAARPAAAGGGAAPAAAAAAAEEERPAVRAYDRYCREFLDPFIAAGAKLGAEGTAMAALVAEGFAAQRRFLVIASKCKKPAADVIMQMLAPLRDVFTKANRGIKRGDFENHQKGINEGIQALGWLSVAPAPREYIESYIGGSDFWMNKVRVQYKATNPDQIEFCTTFKNLLTNLVPFVKECHMAGVEWNARGGDVNLAEATAAPAAAAAPAPAAAQAKAEAPAAGAGAKPVGLGDVFAGIQAIDQSSGRTAGLRQVKKEEQTWRAEFKGGDAPAPAPAAKAKATPRTAETVKGPPRCEYVSGKWMVENQSGMCEVNDVDKKHSVQIFGCIGATIVITGKAKTISVDGCKRTKVIFDDAVSSIELVNCQRMQVQIRNTCPVVAIDKTDGCLTYLSATSMDTQFICSKSSEMNVAYPRPGTTDDFLETPIPEQFVHRVVIETGKMSADVSDLYSH